MSTSVPLFIDGLMVEPGKVFTFLESTTCEKKNGFLLIVICRKRTLWPPGFDPWWPFLHCRIYNAPIKQLEKYYEVIKYKHYWVRCIDKRMWSLLCQPLLCPSFAPRYQGLGRRWSPAVCRWALYFAKICHWKTFFLLPKQCSFSIFSNLNDNAFFSDQFVCQYTTINGK